MESEQDLHVHPTTYYELNYIYFGVSHLTGKLTEHEDENIPIRLANVKKFNTSMCKNMGGTGSSI